MMKKRLLMILGAGSSIECGMPSVASIEQEMRKWAASYSAQTGRQNCFEIIWKALEESVAPEFASVSEPVNFERALGELASLMHWVRPSPAGNALRALIGDGALYDALKFSHPSQHGPNIETKSELSHLLARLAEFMREKASSLDKDSENVLRWRSFLNALRARFEVAIYSLNYDNVALSCWPDAFTGFDEHGEFNSASVHGRKWEGLFHLHGSVHFSLRDILGGRICWRDNLSGSFDDCDDRSADEKSDGRFFPSATFIAGGYKLDQLLGEPFSTYHASLVRDTALADAVILGGYGFTDMHVNRALQNVLSVNASRPPVCVLDYALENTDPMDFREDRWARALTRALHAPGPYAAPGHVHPPVPRELAETVNFELSAPHRVAIWHGGFVGAERASGRMLDWLEGGDDIGLAPR